MVFSKITSRRGGGHFSSSGVAWKLAASSVKRSSLRRQHIFYHAGKSAASHQANIPNHESRRAHPEGV